MIIQAPFKMKRRGVALKLHLGEAPPEIDQTLVQNILKGQIWFAKVIAGETLSEIAETEGVSKRRIQDQFNLVLLAPDILDHITSGGQPKGLTPDYLIKIKFPLSGQNSAHSLPSSGRASRQGAGRKASGNTRQSRGKPARIGPKEVFGRGSRVRTRDLRFWRPSLYQLSYTPRAMAGIKAPLPGNQAPFRLGRWTGWRIFESGSLAPSS